MTLPDSALVMASLKLSGTMVGVEGFEPPNNGTKIRGLNRLTIHQYISYSILAMHLSYTESVGAAGFEPTIFFAFQRSNNF